MNTSLRLFPLLLSLSAPLLPPACADSGAGPLEITPALVDQLMAEARAQSASLGAAGARADAASAAVDSVRGWDDPVFSFGLWGSTPRGMKASQEGDLVYGLEQKLPLFGRPGLARQVAQAQASRERLNVGYETEVLRRDLTLALLDLALSEREIGLAREHQDWIETTLASVDSRYRSGQASQVEWLKVQTEKAESAEELRSLRLMRGSLEEQVNRVLNRDLHAHWPAVSLPELAGPVPFGDRMVAAAVAFAPRLKVLQQETAASDAAARLTQRQRMPEIGVGLQTRQYSGDGGFREGMMTVNLSLPWLNGTHYDSDARRDRATARAAEREAQDFAVGIREEVHHVAVDLDAARRRALLYRDQILPLTEQTLSSARAAWENGRGLFQDILDAHRMLVENQLVVVRSVAEQRRKLAELTFLTGVSDPPSAFADASREAAP